MLLYFQMKKHWNISPNLNLLFLKSEKLVGGVPIQYIFPHLPYGESAFRQVMKMDFKSTQINVQSKGMYGKKGKEQQKMF